MATSFAAYASQFLRQQGASIISSSSQQPMFFSFTTDEGSQAGNDFHDREIELDDEGDPHLRRSDMIFSKSVQEVDDEDPYLRLDDEEPVGGSSRHHLDSMPLIASERPPSQLPPIQGWLAHQAPMSYRSGSPAPSDASSSSIGHSPDPVHAAITRPMDTPLPPQTAISLTQSLLPRDGQSRPVDVFYLPDPRRLPGRRRYNDAIWTALWCFSVSACVIGSILILFTTKQPPNPKGSILPYTTLLHTVPLLTILTFLSAIVSYAHIMLLRTFVRPMLFATSVFVPATLFISALWAFIGSFMWDGDEEPTWGETVGLRFFSIIPLVLALYTSRRLLSVPQEIQTTSSVLTLSTQILIANPLLLALSPLILLASLIFSIPFLTLSFRLLLAGHFTRKREWHLNHWAGWAICGTIGVWLWSWGVGRGVLRTTCAAVVGAWYFHPSHQASPPPMSTHRIHAALYRAAAPSLGTIVASALLLTAIRLLAVMTTMLRRVPLPLFPCLAHPLRFLVNLTNSLSTYALVYTGLTGDAFFPSVRRARVLTSTNRENRFPWSAANSSLTILNVTPLTLTLPCALTAYLFVAHTLGAPDYAPVAALLAGGVTALVGLFCVGLVQDTADALYVCYCIDRDVGEMHHEEVFNAFEGRGLPRTSPPPIPLPPSADPQPGVVQPREPQPRVFISHPPIHEPLVPPKAWPANFVEHSHEDAEDADSIILPMSNFST